MKLAVIRAGQILMNNTNCAGLFSSSAMVNNDFGGSPAKMLADYWANGLITDNVETPGSPPANSDPFPGPGVAAATTAGGSLIIGGIRTAVPEITINAGGFFFNGGTLNGKPVWQISGSGFKGVSSVSQMQDVVIIHELLHAAGVFGADAGPGVAAGASAANTATVVKNCIK
jgi:hypothetical protein